MSDLISRLQALTGPSREIDAEIALANGWTRVNSGIPPSSADPYWRGPHGQIQPGVPLYTASASIDAALTLWPEPLSWHLSRRDGTGSAYVWFVGTETHDGFGAHDCPAIALLIAIVRAKEAAKQEMETKP